MKTIAKLSVREYERIVATGVFDGKNRRRVELIRGELRELSPIGPAHADIVAWLTKWSVRNIPTDDISVRVQSSLALEDADCEPEPDIVWVGSDRFLAGHPTAADVLLLIEVADSSLDYDRGEKADLYAEAGITDYWVVNVIDRTVEVHRSPANDHYADVRSFGIGDSIQPPAAPDATLENRRALPRAAMSKPFQFSMRRMFAAVACFCVVAWSLSRLKGVYIIDSADLLSFAAACVFTGGGIGTICGKPVMGVVYGILAFIVLCVTAPVVIRT